jgi:hypothetical protein
MRNAGGTAVALAAGVALLMASGGAFGAALDEAGDITLGVRTYTDARVGSQTPTSRSSTARRRTTGRRSAA